MDLSGGRHESVANKGEEQTCTPLASARTALEERGGEDAATDIDIAQASRPAVKRARILRRLRVSLSEK